MTAARVERRHVDGHKKRKEKEDASKSLDLLPNKPVEFRRRQIGMASSTAEHEQRRDFSRGEGSITFNWNDDARVVSVSAVILEARYCLVSQA